MVSSARSCARGSHSRRSNEGIGLARLDAPATDDLARPAKVQWAILDCQGLDHQGNQHEQSGPTDSAAAGARSFGFLRRSAVASTAVATARSRWRRAAPHAVRNVAPARRREWRIAIGNLAAGRARASTEHENQFFGLNYQTGCPTAPHVTGMKRKTANIDIRVEPPGATSSEYLQPDLLQSST